MADAVTHESAIVPDAAVCHGALRGADSLLDIATEGQTGRAGSGRVGSVDPLPWGCRPGRQGAPEARSAAVRAG